MNLIDNLTRFVDKMPPEDVDLFVAPLPYDGEDCSYDIMRFYKAGSTITEMGVGPSCADIEGRTCEEKLVKAILSTPIIKRKAPKSGYYFLTPINDNECRYHLSSLNPLESGYIVIRPCDEDGECDDDE